jgi:hypothetical protein
VKSRQFKDPLANGEDEAMLLEIRGTKADGGIGFLTIVPPSTHPSGEKVEFEPGFAHFPAIVDASHLESRAATAAAAALLARHWPGEGNRHDAFLALAGLLCNAGWTSPDAINFLRAIYEVLWPGEVDESAIYSEVGSTWEKHERGVAITGLTRLGELIAPAAMNTALHWMQTKGAAKTDKSQPESPPTFIARIHGYIFDPRREFSPDRTFYEGLLSEGDLVIWLGREKHRKTTLILQFGICAATARPFLNFPFVPGEPLHVLVLDFESKTGSLRYRYQAICDAMGLTPDELEVLERHLHIVEVRRLITDGYAFPRFAGSGRGKEELASREEAAHLWRILLAEIPADIVVFDPMRSMHTVDENDSSIETLMSRLRQTLPKRAIIIAHHMRKYHVAGNPVSLSDDMRLWSDGARGSSAIKAHADVIVCQERTMDQNHTEVLHVGAFLKDGADIEPLKLEESDTQSYFWVLTADVPEYLTNTVAALQKAGGRFADQAACARVLREARFSKPTAYRHLEDLRRRGLLAEESGGVWVLKAKLKTIGMGAADFIEPRRRGHGQK